MSETELINKARKLISENKRQEAAAFLWNLYSSRSPIMRLNAILSLTEIIDQTIENEKLLKICDKGIEIAEALNKDDIKAFLMGKRGSSLLFSLVFLIYRKKNLKLAASIFKWIDFSLEKDRDEYEEISHKCHDVEKEVQDIEASILAYAESSTDHKFRGHIFSSLGDFCNSRYWIYKSDLFPGGKFRSKIYNIYFTKRWNLDSCLYGKAGRLKIRTSKSRCIYYYKKAIQEFEAGNRTLDMAYACYNLANNMRTMFSFSTARKYLIKARKLAEAHSGKQLLDQIELLQRKISDRNRNIPDYAEISGLDLP